MSAAAVANPLDDLAGLFDDPAFKAAPQEERAAVVEYTLAQGSQFLREQPDWKAKGKDYHREFTAVAKWAREQLDAAETTGQTAKRYLGVAGRTIGDAAATIGATVADINPIGSAPDTPAEDGLGLELKMPGRGTLYAFRGNMEKLGDSIDTAVKKAASGTNERLASGLDELKKDIDEAKFPLHSREKFEQWLGKRSDHLQGLQRSFYRAMEDGEDWSNDAIDQAAKASRLDTSPDHVKWLTEYMATRSPQAWDALSKSILSNPSRRALEQKAAERVAISETARSINEMTGHAAGDTQGPGVTYVTEAGDPFEVAGTAVPIFKGAKVLAKGASLGRRALHAAEGIGAEVVSELGSQVMDDPTATPADRLRVAKEALAGVLGLEAVGMGVHALRRKPSGPAASTGEGAQASGSRAAAQPAAAPGAEIPQLNADDRGAAAAGAAAPTPAAPNPDADLSQLDPANPDVQAAAALLPPIDDGTSTSGRLEPVGNGSGSGQSPASAAARLTPTQAAFRSATAALADPEDAPDPSDLSGLPMTPPTPVDPQGTLAESPETLQAQRFRVQAGLKPAMLLPGAAVEDLAPEFLPAEGEGMVATDTEAGAVLHNEALSPEEVQAAVANGQTGELLGTGLPTKPADATHVLVHRGPDGTTIHDVAVSPDTEPQALAALTQQAMEGDTIDREEIEEPIKRRARPYRITTPEATKWSNVDSLAGGDGLSTGSTTATPSPRQGESTAGPSPLGRPETGQASVQRSKGASPDTKGQATVSNRSLSAVLSKSEQALVERIQGQLGEAKVTHGVIEELRQRAAVQRGYERTATETAHHYDTHPEVKNPETAGKQRAAARIHGKEAAKIEGIISKLEPLAKPAPRRESTGQSEFHGANASRESLNAEPVLSGDGSLESVEWASAQGRRIVGHAEGRAGELGAVVVREGESAAGLAQTPESGAVEGRSPVRVVAAPDGTIGFVVHAGRLIEGKWAEARQRGAAFLEGLASVLAEEHIHIASLRAWREEWLKLDSHSRPGFDLYVAQRGREMLADIQAAVDALPRRAAERIREAFHAAWRLYFRDSAAVDLTSPQALWEALQQPDGAARVAGGATPFLVEFARQIVQLQRTDRLSETAAASVLARIKKWVIKAVRRLKQVYTSTKAGHLGPQFRAWIERTEAILDRVDARPPESASRKAPASVDLSLGGAEFSGFVQGVKNAPSFLRDAWRALGKLPQFTPYRAAINTWVGRMQRSALSVQKLQKELERRVPDPLRREAITNYVQAGGDMATLQAWQAKSKGRLAKGYEIAQNLTPDEIAVAAEVRSFYDQSGAMATKEGVLNSWKTNYVNKVWKDRFFTAKLSRNFQFAKHATHENFFEGEQDGLSPATKDISKLMGLYLNELHRTIATRRLIKDLTGRKASDGRPLAAPLGGTLLKPDPTDPTGAGGPGILILPNARRAVRFGPNVNDAPNMVDVSDYRRLNHSALSKWKFLQQADETAADSKPVLILGELAAHPEIADHLTNALGIPLQNRWLKQAANSPVGRVLRKAVSTAIMVGSVVKQTMLSLSPFHIVQEGTHAVGHKVNPFLDIPVIDPDNVDHQDAMNHGLMLGGDELAVQHFMDGLGKAPLLERIPYFGQVARAISDFTFHTYIPGLKLKTYNHILGRNLARFGSELKAGTVTPSDVKYLSARQANSAYGHLNYKDLGRNPHLQKLLQAVFLAPDFLEARGRFALSALQPGKVGAEQRIAMLTLAVTFYVAARALNAACNDGDPKWAHPFSVVVGGREYAMRSVPEDIYKLFKDTRKFIYGRLSPLIGHTTVELLTAKNYRGEKVAWSQTMADAVLRAIPISLRMAPGLRSLSESTANNPVSPWEQFVGSIGVQITRHSPITEAGKLAADFAEKSGKLNPGVYPISPYRNLRFALEDLDDERAAKEIEALKKTHSRDKLIKGFKASTFRAWTGSTALDAKFYRTLQGEDAALISLARQRRLEVWNRFARLIGAPKLGSYPSPH